LNITAADLRKEGKGIVELFKRGFTADALIRAGFASKDVNLLNQPSPRTQQDHSTGSNQSGGAKKKAIAGIVVGVLIVFAGAVMVLKVGAEKQERAAADQAIARIRSLRAGRQLRTATNDNDNGDAVYGVRVPIARPTQTSNSNSKSNSAAGSELYEDFDNPPVTTTSADDGTYYEAVAPAPDVAQVATIMLTANPLYTPSSADNNVSVT
jgi:hypothetical protein